jgi:hypothetical protein
MIIEELEMDRSYFPVIHEMTERFFRASTLNLLQTLDGKVGEGLVY